MQEDLTIQIQHESNAWKRKMIFLSDENNQLKNRLSWLPRKGDAGLLLKAEEFHESFLKNDEMINMIRRDTVEFDKLISEEHSYRDKFTHQLLTRLRQLRIEINMAEKYFNDLQNKFNEYLTQELQSGIN